MFITCIQIGDLKLNEIAINQNVCDVPQVRVFNSLTENNSKNATTITAAE